MINTKIIIRYIFAVLSLFPTLSKSEVTNTIVVKVGNEIITSYDIKNEILTNIILNNNEINQKNIDAFKKIAVKNLINKKIKNIEIKKYKIERFNTDDLQTYLSNIAKSFNTDITGLKNIFKYNEIDYDLFVNNYKTELLWNTLIFQIYFNQTNINIIEVENEINKFKNEKTQSELEDLKNQILNQKKEEKLQLYSRSHFTNLENSIQVKFN